MCFGQLVTRLNQTAAILILARPCLFNDSSYQLSFVANTLNSLESTSLAKLIQYSLAQKRQLALIMNQLIFFLLALNLAQSTLCPPGVIRGASSAGAESWKELYDKLFSTALQSLEPEDTLDSLNQLEEKLRISDDKDSIAKYSQVMSLIKAKDASENSCMLYKGGYANLFEKHATQLNLKAYLNYHYSRQSMICRNLLEKNLKQGVDKISENMQEDVNLLRDSVVEENNRKPIGIYQGPSMQVIDEGVLLYLERKFGPLYPITLDKADGKKKYEGYVDRISTMCKFVLMQLQESRRIHEQFWFGPNEVDNFAFKWLENGLICAAIRADPQAIFKGSYQILLNKSSGKREQWNKDNKNDNLVSI